MHGFEVLADPVRRRILELLAEGAQAAGDIAATITREFSISQPAVSQHLKVLRDHDFAIVHKDGTRRLYELRPAALTELETWLARLHPPVLSALDALETEIARGRRERRTRGSMPGTRATDERRRSS
ncbi:metalloregulator ArsR/SmtB family transcription factor [Rhodococcus sp. Z13]|uniref:Metalloregulator ArsR/SmtB family transcription factor n=1 Tax=Rhodococcus sacchari TaxID=2962047 RepID=A0ACD4DM71_9NOCA|nr:metalloregulator ArsR/SmtB family transcription factor [Rhodococcus sp. Z13]UYP21140.1 metalloregulator ArsR/SmtB family transcription factor [Rhodococcus sp. Z13]